ncbi:unnamed protein product [Rhodiola kirilowii]
MHVEKNICDSLIGTLLNIPGKTKDGLKARLDMLEMNIRTKLAPQTEGKRTYLPPSCTTLSKNEKTILCGCLKGVKLLPIAIRGVLSPKVRSAVQRLCVIFSSLSAKVVDSSELDKLQD